MGLGLDYQPGQTPLDEEESEGLKIKTITTQGELNEFEQNNIEHALLWLKKQRIASKQILTENFILKLHQKMYGEVWKWAGKFRNSEKNIGIHHSQIGIELKKLLDDAQFWIDYQTFTPDEIAIRFKHRLVSIHCFPNGNGRHSRLMADLIVEKIFGRPHFTWGHSHSHLSENNNARISYLQALKLADKNQFQPLIDFARS
jgi:Fic-DOC domain mobile mystery protein B